MHTGARRVRGTGVFCGSESNSRPKKAKNYPRKSSPFPPLQWLAVCSRLIVNISRAFYTTIRGSKSGVVKILRFPTSCGCAEAGCFLSRAPGWDTFTGWRDGPGTPRPNTSQLTPQWEITEESSKPGGMTTKNISMFRGPSQQRSSMETSQSRPSSEKITVRTPSIGSWKVIKTGTILDLYYIDFSIFFLETSFSYCAFSPIIPL